ncbi:GGDEF domain-containing protein [Oceanobacter mangrovi]|uniref:GGDEF domain-containing protein n=1 Tax=Oceanobacter mangrovi TaxID=2862510 RepID=UPI001C8E98C0|nr:GGDEF domain-containing protein [Oceanobacter mangrovi]
MNLKPRFLLLTAVLMLLSALAIWWFSQKVALDVLQQSALRHFETQVKLEKERSLQPIIREVALARQLAESPTLRNWANDESDPQKRQLALAELESYRNNFSDHSYFAALLKSGNYYHNNASDEFANAQYRYTLRADNPDDRWFYSIIDQRRDIHLNVNPDIPLKVTKLWIDVLLRDGDNILGVVGTGLDLTTFIQQFTTTPEPGVNNLFFDHEGAIQISEDLSQIDFASITKDASDHKTIWRQLDDDNQRNKLKQAMENARSQPDQVVSMNLVRHGSKHMAGVIYLPEVDWYVMTLLDLNTLLPLSTFNELFLLTGTIIFAALLLFNLALNRYVLKPLRKLENGIARLHDSKPVETTIPGHIHGDFGRILGHFSEMAAEVLQSRERLELRVRQRTEELEQMTYTDPVTGLLNRHGMMEQLMRQMDKLHTATDSFGIVWLDLDLFKNINDEFGHAAGDLALKATAQVIREHIRPDDFACRWGGDEFLLLVNTDQQFLLDQLGRRLCGAVQKQEVRTEQNAVISLTISAGSCLAQPDQLLNDVLATADQALYEAKASGRNRYCPGLMVEHSQ